MNRIDDNDFGAASPSVNSPLNSQYNSPSKVNQQSNQSLAAEPASVEASSTALERAIVAQRRSSNNNLAADHDDEEIFTTVEDTAISETHEERSSMRDTLTRIPEALGAIGHKLSGTFERAIHARDDYVVAVKVSSEAQDKLEQLVAAGVFRSRAEAAAYLIDEGINAQTALFERVSQKLSEIERLQTELRGLVTDSPTE